MKPSTSATLVYAFDLGQHCGVASGDAGDARPSSDVWELKRAGEQRGMPGWNLIAACRVRWKHKPPDLVVKEAAPTFEAMRRMSNGQAAMLATAGYHMIVEALCAGHGIDCVNVWPSTWRKHFLGRANFGNREATKHAAVARCHELGYFARNEVDDNRAEACGIWDYAVNAIVRVNKLSQLHLFDEGLFT
jgi:hypothetical protein